MKTKRRTRNNANNNAESSSEELETFVQKSFEMAGRSAEVAKPAKASSLNKSSTKELNGKTLKKSLSKVSSPERNTTTSSSTTTSTTSTVAKRISAFQILFGGYAFANFFKSFVLHSMMGTIPCLASEYLGGRENSLFPQWDGVFVVSIVIFFLNVTVAFIANQVTAISLWGQPDPGWVHIESQLKKDGTFKSDTEKNQPSWRVLQITGLLGAVAAGVAIRMWLPKEPFGEQFSLMHSVFEKVLDKSFIEKPSLLSNCAEAFLQPDSPIFNGLKTISQGIMHVYSAVTGALHFTLSNKLGYAFEAFYNAPMVSSKLMADLHASTPLQKFRIISVFFDVLMVEFLLCTLLYIASIIKNVAAETNEKAAKDIILIPAIVSLSIVFMTPICGIACGPMLGISFTAMVTGQQGDILIFLINGLADFCASRVALSLFRNSMASSSKLKGE